MATETMSPWKWQSVAPTPRQVLIDYMLVKLHQGDWHAVRDAAVDLELLELRLSLDQSPHETYLTGDPHE
jgi:hypothetical protein